MNVNIKYAFLFAACLGMSTISYAQTRDAKTGEIVMTKDELESFLDKIAELKRQQMEKRKNELMINKRFSDETGSPSNTATLSESDRLYREFDRINSRIDMMMMNMNGGARSYNNYPPATTYQQRPYYYEDTYSGQYQQPNTVTEAVPSTSPEEMEVQRQINALKEELRVLNMLSQNSTNADYENDIKSLNERLNELNNRGTDQHVVVINNQDKLLKGLEDYKHNIFFDNNKSNVGTSDRSRLQELAQTVKQHAPRITVVIRGFASNTGSAKYNNELSFKRAEAVKQVLLDAGLDARDIMIMHHGIDKNTSADQARRVELSLLVQ